MSVFGPIVIPDVVEQQLTAHLKTWMPDYLAEMCRVTGRDNPVPAIKTWGLADLDPDQVGDKTTPALMVEASDFDLTERADAIDADFDTSISVITRSEKSALHVRSLSQVYATAAALILMQQPLTGVTVTWKHGRYQLFPKSRYLALAEHTFTVHVEQIAFTDAGPAEPSVDPTVPPPEYPTAETVVITAGP